MWQYVVGQSENRKMKKSDKNEVHLKASQPDRSQPTGLMAVIPMFVDASAILVSDVVGKEVFGRDRQVLDRLLKELSSKESSFTLKKGQRIN